MGQPVVLPKFELSGKNRPHWAVLTAWIVGGVLLLSVVGLGVIVVHHRNLVTQAHMARAEALAKIRAEADAKVAMAAAVAKAQREAELSAKLAAQAVPATTVPNAGVPASDSAAAKAARSSHTARPRPHGGTAGGSKGTRSATGANKSGGKSEAKSTKPDAIDELLRKMR